MDFHNFTVAMKLAGMLFLVGSVAFGICLALDPCWRWAIMFCGDLALAFLCLNWEPDYE